LARATPAPGRRTPVEHESERVGTVDYVADWNVHRGVVVGPVEDWVTISAFDAFPERIVNNPRCHDARPVFLVVDSGTVHRGQRFNDRGTIRLSTPVAGHLPIHAS
jgi:hypothetical protein